MIKLNKASKPEILVKFGDAWLADLKAVLASGGDPTDSQKSRYRHPEIKAALRTETNGKCAYCESYIFHISFGDVEHIIPKSKDIDLIFEWENLTIACDKCNTYKSANIGVIDPYNTDPSEHFTFLGPMIVPLTGSILGKFTEITLQLNRIELVERRINTLKRIADQITIISNTQDEKLRDVLLQDFLNNDLSDASEFSAFIQAFKVALDIKDL